MNWPADVRAHLYFYNQNVDAEEIVRNVGSGR